LEAEGILFDERGDVDMALYGWEGPEWGELDELMRGET
jgi:hypothetical protein